MAAADAAGAGAGTLGGLGADDEQPMLLLCTQAARLFALALKKVIERMQRCEGARRL